MVAIPHGIAMQSIGPLQVIRQSPHGSPSRQAFSTHLDQFIIFLLCKWHGAEQDLLAQKPVLYCRPLQRRWDQCSFLQAARDMIWAGTPSAVLFNADDCTTPS